MTRHKWSLDLFNVFSLINYSLNTAWLQYPVSRLLSISNLTKNVCFKGNCGGGENFHGWLLILDQNFHRYIFFSSSESVFLCINYPTKFTYLPTVVFFDLGVGTSYLPM